MDKITKDPAIYTKVSVVKGWLYVLLTAAFLYWLISSYSRQRTRSEIILRESEQRFRTFFEAHRSVMLLVDPDTGRIIDANPAAADYYGYNRDAFRSLSISDINLLSPEELKNKLHTAAGAQSNFFILPHRLAGGEIRTVEVYTSPVEINQKKLLFSIIHDITERKLAEEALLKSEKMLQTIIEAEPECVKILDENANLVMMNRAGLDMLQVDSLDQVRGQCVCPLITSEYRDSFMDLTKRVFQGESGTLLFEIVGVKGRHLWLETHAVPLRNEQDEITALLGVTRDVTERKRAEEDLLEKEMKYRLLFESANDGIFILDETGFIDCNQRGAEMYGLTKGEIIGRHPNEFALKRQPDGRSSSEVAEEKIRTALSGVPQLFEWRPVRSDGSPFDVEVTLNRLELGDKICVQAIVRDISERKRLEQEMLKIQKLEAIGTLAGGIAHEFNNLLQGIFGYISLAKITIDKDGPRTLAVLEQAEQALLTSVNLTTQLLTFSKGGKPAKKKIPLRPVIENSARFALSGSKSDCRIKLQDRLWEVEADEVQIAQMIQNIVLNAAQAMPEGGDIVISAKNIKLENKEHFQLPRGNYVEISIRDNGVGIAGKDLQKIFDPYFSTKEKGSGLGLATSYSIVKNHGGFVHVTSEPGKGSTFFIYLPSVEANKEISETIAAPSGARKGKILVVDDEELIRNVAGELIRVLGHDVELAEFGETAVENYHSAMESGSPFDIVILDLTMRGGIGGKETLERLKGLDPEVKAIVSSGYSDNSVIADYEKYGFKARLTKPYRLETLRDTLNALLIM